MLYAGYYNITQASQASTPASSRRASEKSTDSQVQQSRRSSIKRALDMLRPTEEPLTVEGIYAPVIKEGALFQKKEKLSKEEKKQRKAEKQAQRYKWNMERARYELISAAA